jgi:hypothetical protein
MSNLNQFTAVIKLDFLEISSFIEDQATTSGSATVISAISAANHKINLETSKSSPPNITLYTKMPSGTVLGQQCYVVVSNQLYGNHYINLLNTDDVSLGSGPTNTIWILNWIGTKWLEIAQVNG